MNKTAAEFEQVDQSLQRMLSKLMTRLDGLQWKGAGARSFEQVKLKWAQDQAAMSRALAETAEAIRASAQKYDASDSQAAGRLAATNRGIDLPL